MVDAPARDGIERRRTERLARFETEARVVQGTSDGLADDQTIGQLPAIVGAVRPDGEETVSAPHQTHLVVADFARKG